MSPDHPLYRRWLDAFGEPPIVGDEALVEQLLEEFAPETGVRPAPTIP